MNKLFPRTRAAAALLFALAALCACQRGPNLPAQDSPDYRRVVSAFYVGLSALQVGDDVRAEEKLKEATAVAPEEPTAWANLGLLYLRQRQFDRAAEVVTRARELAPDNSRVQFLAGQLESSRGRYDEAVKAFRRAAELDAKNLKAIYALAVEAERAGDEEEQARQLARVLEVEPRNLSVQLDAARLAAKRGDAELFNRLKAGFDEQSAAWPSEAKEQLRAVEEASAGGNLRAAAPRVQFLRNVLVRLPEFRQSRLAVQDPPEVLGQPFTRFILLASPEPRPAAPDEGLTYNVETPPHAADAGALAWAGAISLTGEGAPALVFADGRSVRLSGGVTLPFPGGASATPPTTHGVAGLDYNYDFKTDLAFAGEGGFRLFKQENATTFADATAATRLSAALVNAPAWGVWPADVEADGDLDILLAPRDGAPVVLRNNGDGSFAEQQPFEPVAALRDFAWADFDGDGDPDAALLDASYRLHLFTNERTGQFRPRAAPADTPRLIALGVADINSDGRFDLLVLTDNGLVRRFSDRDDGAAWDAADVLRAEGLHFSLAPGGARVRAADLDNNGGADLLISDGTGARAWLTDAEGKLRPLNLEDALTNARSLSAADTNADGRLDLVGVAPDGKALVAASRGTKNYHWQVIRPRAANATGDQRINSFGVGGEIEIRSALLAQKQQIAGPLVHFGLGEQEQTDVARVIWPNGSTSAEFELKADESVLAEQRLKGSCPSLFAYDGSKMSFVKDCAPWSPAIGLRINNYQTLKVQQTEEWVKIAGAQLAPREGFYDLRITAELWETYYLDHYALAVVDHAPGTEVFVDERTANTPPALRVYTLKTPRPFASARDDDGRDVSEVVMRRDGRHLDNFGRGSHQGVTRDHFVEVELPEDAPLGGPLWLVAHGWLHPTDASINVAISQGANPPPRGLSLEVADGRGGWQVARPDLGFPAGKNKTILVDLNGVFKEGAPRRARLRTNMEIFWDALEWAAEPVADEGGAGGATRVERLDPTTAELQFRGFSEMRQADKSSPETPVYDRLASTGQKWRDLTGYYTRFGDVRELLAQVDDRVVIANGGDELVLRFAERAAPPAGWSRDYVLIGNGWIKDGDYNSQFSKTVLPLPSRDREYYTTLPTRLEDDPVYRRHPQDWQNFHTRYVTPRVFNGALWAK